MLPHTVYLYGKPNVEQREVQLSHVIYDLEGKRLTGTLFNASTALIRVQSVKATSPHSGGKANDEAGGFPLLPGRSRRFELAWKEPAAPTAVECKFTNFTLKQAITSTSE